jgi:NAD(P)-dependent dehydrogenase (short-subunit alcohol dehydrogenase family)
LAKETRIVITGGTRGLGRALAARFLALGAAVFITGREADKVAKAVKELGEARPGSRIGGGAGDIGESRDLLRLAAEAKAFLGGVDHWINNAGINQEPGKVMDLGPAEMEVVIRTDLLGPLYAVAAARDLVRESGGFMWFMEGHGSDGRIMDGLSLYGTAKRGVAYLWRALAKECEGSGFRVGALSPGIMATDFILRNREKSSPDKWARTARAFNILADRPETVADWLAPRILAAKDNGTRLAWLTTGKILGRFLSAPFVKRHIVD